MAETTTIDFITIATTSSLASVLDEHKRQRETLGMNFKTPDEFFSVVTDEFTEMSKDHEFLTPTQGIKIRREEAVRIAALILLVIEYIDTFEINSGSLVDAD